MHHIVSVSCIVRANLISALRQSITIVLDACIGDVSSPHLHHLFYSSVKCHGEKNGEKSETSSPSDLTSGSTSKSDSESTDPKVSFVPFTSANSDENHTTCSIFGRTCMEFDMLPGYHDYQI